MTISIFPSPAELLAVFGVEPDVFDDQQPWSNNTLDFVIQDASDRLHCRLFSRHQQCFIHWWRNGIELVDIDIRNVDSVQARIDQHRATLSVTLPSNDVLATVLIHIRPYIHVAIYAFNTPTDP